MAEYIERETLIEKLNEAPAYFDSGDIRYGIDIATSMVIEQPTADVVEVKHGEWICLEQEIGLYECSLCNHKMLRSKSNFCPNCGAKMDKRSNNNA